MEKNDISVNRLESVISGMYVYSTDQNIMQMGGPHPIELNLEMQKCTNDYSGWSNGLLVKALDSQSRGHGFKTTGWLQGRPSFSSYQGR